MVGTKVLVINDRADRSLHIGSCMSMSSLTRKNVDCMRVWLTRFSSTGLEYALSYGTNPIRFCSVVLWYSASLTSSSMIFANSRSSSLGSYAGVSSCMCSGGWLLEVGSGINSCMNAWISSSGNCPIRRRCRSR